MAPRRSWLYWVGGGLLAIVLIVGVFLVARGTASSSGDPMATAQVIVAQTLTAQPPAATPEPRVITTTPLPAPANTQSVPPPAGLTATPSGNAQFDFQSPLTGEGFVQAGADFFAISVLDVDGGFQEVEFATNGDKCNDPSRYVWQLSHAPDAALKGQWADCDHLSVFGVGPFLFTLKNVSEMDLHLLMGGVGGKYTVNGGPWTDFGSDTGVEVPTSNTVAIGVALTNGMFYLQRVPNQLATSGTFDWQDQGDGKMRVIRSSLETQPCAWSAFWRVDATSSVSVDFPICLKLVLVGTGDVTLTVYPDNTEGGYDTANQSGLGLALWPTGQGTWDVLEKSGTWTRGLVLDQGSEGVDLPLAGGPRQMVFHLNGGKIEIPLGDITRDLSQSSQPIVRPIH